MSKKTSIYLFCLAMLCFILFGASAKDSSYIGMAVFGAVGLLLLIAALPSKRVTPEELRKKAIEMLRDGKVEILGKGTYCEHYFEYISDRAAWQHTKIYLHEEDPEKRVFVNFLNKHHAVTALYVVLLENCLEEETY